MVTAKTPEMGLGQRPQWSTRSGYVTSCVKAQTGLALERAKPPAGSPQGGPAAT
jgi:hypothetical protein